MTRTSRLRAIPLATLLATALAVAGVTAPAAGAQSSSVHDPSFGIRAPLPGLGHDTSTGELSPQTEAVGDFWEGVRPLMAHENVNDDPAFYTAPEDVNLQETAPGTVLRERTLDYHVATIPTPLKVTQLLYATTNVRGEIEANATSVIHPPGGSDGNVVSYQSIYDSSNPADNPSRAIAGNLSLGSLLPAVETAIVAPALLAGHPVVLADTEGADVNFAAGPGYGYATLDSLRAATTAASSPVKESDDIGLLGYSGGSIASNWAAIHLKEYAPELEDRVIGVAQGGMLINPVSNLEYAGDGIIWSGVVGLALAALVKAYDIDVDDYLTEYGRKALDDMSELSIVEAMARYPGLTWSQIAKPEYPTPQDVPEVKTVIEDINMGNWSSPTVPMFIFQGAGGFIEGTPAHGEHGPGDGIMVSRDVRTIVRQYCEAGAPIEYREYPYASHVIAGAPWLIEGYLWLEGRFNGKPATNNCDTVPRGNEL
ncbi:MAG: lipase family protein [Corynebacterium sp.]|uniref:lipase family protein n=1 Tax=Corynebacterium sp. TaxID=1720 RepID=UPI003F998CE7